MGSPKFIDTQIGMVRLWSHELKRVFEDRLTTTDDHAWFVSQLTECVSSKFGMKWSDIVRTERADSASSSTLNLIWWRRWRRGQFVPASFHAGLLYCDFVDPNADPRVYQEVEDIDKLKLVVNDFLEEHNAESKSPMPLARARRPFVLIRRRRDSWPSDEVSGPSTNRFGHDA